MKMIDLTQLQSFVAVEQMGSFTLAAERLGLGQSTVSQHIQRLEATLGRKLLARDTHRVVLTGDGEALLGHARTMLSIQGQVQSLFADNSLRGTLRLGVSEDFVTSQLPAVLEEFVRSHPSVDLELTVALSGALYEMQDNGELDLVLAKRRLGDVRGRLVYREPLIWLARDPERIRALTTPLPLIAFPAPSVTRAVALEALRRQQVPWRIVCTCGSLSGLTAQHGTRGPEGDSSRLAAGARRRGVRARPAKGRGSIAGGRAFGRHSCQGQEFAVGMTPH